MAKESKKVKTRKWNKKIDANRVKRMSLSSLVKNSGDMSASFSLSKNRSVSIVRRKNRCGITGKPRAFIRLVGMCRNAYREAVVQGLLPGFKKV